MKYPSRVSIVEVGARDGLQNEKQEVTAAVKIELVNRLSAAGFRNVEAGSFVSPKWVPQMADTAEVLARIARKPGVRYPVLVPNLKGLEAAQAAGVDEIAVFGAASESFSRKNINASVAESLERFAPVVAAALALDMRVRAYVSTVISCPYEGPIAPKSVAAMAKAFVDMGCYEISLGDTIGTGTPGTTLAMLDAVGAVVPVSMLAGHYHDTFGQALANIHASLQFGIATFDSSVSGLGGCPYAKGASGNVATEDVVYLLHGMGIETGIDLDRLVDTGAFICHALGRESGSRVARAVLAKRAA